MIDIPAKSASENRSSRNGKIPAFSNPRTALFIEAALPYAEENKAEISYSVTRLPGCVRNHETISEL